MTFEIRWFKINQQNHTRYTKNKNYEKANKNNINKITKRKTKD